MGTLAGCIGLDLGSVAVHAVVASTDGEILYGRTLASAGRPLEALKTLVDEIDETWGPLSVPVGVTGSARDLFCSHLPEAGRINEVVASARGAGLMLPHAEGVIEVGGHTSRWMAVRPDGTGDLVDFSLSELCAAGAGVFLEQQAGRLRLTVQELGQVAVTPESGATVAGRCTVFAKSDMIHLQQKGTPVAEIAYGLCLALVRNFQASVLQGRELRRPVALVGGGAANPGLVRAFREVLKLAEDELQIPDRADLAGALGAAVLARSGRSMTVDSIREALAVGVERASGAVRFAPLPDPGCPEPLIEPTGAEAKGPLLLGVDVGSVSTNLALCTPTGTLVDAIYLATRGRPLDVLGEGLALLRERHPDGLQITGVATTGSGRHLAGEFLGDDLVRNEITAQLRGAAEFMDRVDTVFEIGGQDSKYISASGGHIVDFTMNKVCAAGTGSFLEEQADRLGLSIIGEFADRALEGHAPVDLGSRCTVFMDNELVQAMRDGVGTEDLAGGLALSVARNYLEKVVGPRPVGEHVLFQGGTASNRAVVAAFRHLLGRPVQVHPYNRVSGAIGAALLLQDARDAGEVQISTRFRGLDACHGVVEKSFECPQCSNRCQVTRFSSGEATSFFGDTCERYSERDGTRTGAGNADHPMARRWRLLLEASGLSEVSPTAGACSGALGIPRASLAYRLLPIWTELARASGREPVLSPASSSRLLARGQRRLAADACLPVKISYGHVQALTDRGVREILVPAVHSVDGRQQGENGPFVCTFTRHLPWMLRSSFDCHFITPEIELDLPPGKEVLDVEGLASDLGIGVQEVKGAVARGRAALQGWRRRLLAMGREVLDGDSDRILVVMGKPYNLADPFLNMELGRHLDRLGLPAIPMDCLPLDEVELDERHRELVWADNRDYVRASTLVRRDPRLFPVVLSSFGCGPDGFGIKHLEELLDHKPRLFLELDEHRAEAGFVTRLEAFADEIDAHLRREQQPLVPLPPRPDVGFGSSGRLFLPYYSDHARAYRGVLRRAGFEVELLPPPDEQARLLGEELSSGRECHPFTLLAGDLVSLVRSGRQRPGDAFLFPGGANACLFSQYTDGLRHVLRRLGEPDLVISAPLPPQIREQLGVRGGVAFYRGMMATEILLRRSRSHHPYARDPGEVDRVYEELLLELEDAVSRYAVLDFLPSAVDRLDRIPRIPGPRRPLVGVAGDIYTRINPFANGDLFTRLEELGCEVWPAPYSMDLFEYNQPRFARNAARRGDYKRVLSQAFLVAMKSMQGWWLKHRWPDDERLREPSPREILANTAPYLGREAGSLELLNVSKMVDFARRGADGILNAICFGCMVGGISAALTGKLRSDHDDIPIATLAYGGTAGTGGAARLEAFVEQVKRHRQRRLEGGETTRR